MLINLLGYLFLMNFYINILNNMKIDYKSNWYKNCKRRRKEKAKICYSCPFKTVIEKQEIKNENRNI